MSHFPSRDWVDRIHQLESPEQQSQMQRHIEDGCEICHKDSEIWRRVVECLSHDSSFEIPDATIRIVKAAFSGKIPAWFTSAKMPRLLFDSWVHPPAVPARAAGTRGARQVIYETDPFVIDLRMESDPFRQHVLITGQVLNSNRPDKAAEHVEVILLLGDEVVAKTSTNPAGEFDVRCQASHELRLLINIQGQRAIGITLPEIEGQA